MIRVLLYVPQEKDPFGVIHPSFPFARVPVAHREDDWIPKDGWREGAKGGHYVVDTDGPVPDYQNALVLIWDGMIVQEGCDRASRKGGFAQLHRNYTVAQALRRAHALVKSLGGEVVRVGR